MKTSKIYVFFLEFFLVARCCKVISVVVNWLTRYLSWYRLEQFAKKIMLRFTLIHGAMRHGLAYVFSTDIYCTLANLWNFKKKGSSTKSMIFTCYSCRLVLEQLTGLSISKSTAYQGRLSMITIAVCSASTKSHVFFEQTSAKIFTVLCQVFVNNVAVRFVNSVIVMSFILHPVVVRPGLKNHKEICFGSSTFVGFTWNTSLLCTLHFVQCPTQLVFPVSDVGWGSWLWALSAKSLMCCVTGVASVAFVKFTACHSHHLCTDVTLVWSASQTVTCWQPSGCKLSIQTKS